MRMYVIFVGFIIRNDNDDKQMTSTSEHAYCIFAVCVTSVHVLVREKRRVCNGYSLYCGAVYWLLSYMDI